jgi:phosphatidylserine decarboxylase
VTHSEPQQEPVSRQPRFAERPTEIVVRDGVVMGAVPLLLAGPAMALGWSAAAVALLGLALFVAFFFRNPPRLGPEGERAVVAPADGRVLEAGEVERPDGSKLLRVGIFLSIFNVHVNRAPVSGRVVALERGGERYLAAFDRRAEAHNVRCELTLETERGERVGVTQITGLIARRIVCHPRVGEWIERGDRYGLIRFGSRTDVLLPPSARLRVKRGDRVRGGSSVVAELAEEA